MKPGANRKHIHTYCIFLTPDFSLSTGQLLTSQHFNNNKIATGKMLKFDGEITVMIK